MTAKSGVAAVERALSILDAFQDTEDGALTLAAIAANTGLYKSTILRLLVSLEHYGYIRRLNDGRYKLGHKTSLLGALYQQSFNLDEYIRPVLERMVAEVDESATFTVKEDDHLLLLFRVNSKQRIRDHLRAGDTMAIGKVGAGARIVNFFEHKTAADITPDNFCAFSFGEVNPEMSAVSAPIFNEENRFIGALMISGPSYRVTEQSAQRLAEILRREAVQLSLSLGATPAYFEPILKAEATQTPDQ